MSDNVEEKEVVVPENSFKDFATRHGMQIVAVFVLVVVAIALIAHFVNSRTDTDSTQAELMGKGLSALYQGKQDVALSEFQGLLQSNKLNGLALAKVALLTGNIKFQQGDLDGAAALYQKSLDNAGSAPLIKAGAMHGSAAVAIEKKDYAAAAKILEQFVSEFGERSGDLEDRYQKAEAADAVPTVPDALWKLALVYQQLGSNDKAKAAAQKILKVYGDNPVYSDRAKKFLATI